MNIRVSQQPARVPVTVFHVEGRINLDSAGELEQQARDAFENGMRDLLIDLSDAVSMTSAGLRALHIIYKLLEDGPADGTLRKSAHLKLLNPPPHIRRVLAVSGFDRFIDLHDSLQEALASF